MEVREWFQSRLEIADAIFDAFGNRGQYDAAILLCCAMSALASRIWPREKDSLRYVELLVKFAPDPGEVKRISVPILRQKLKDAGDITSAQQLASCFLTELEMSKSYGTELDQSEKTLAASLPALSLRRLREASYAAIIYTDLRCGLVHEYSLSPALIEFGQLRREDMPSYVGVIATRDRNDEAMISEEPIVDEQEIEFLSLDPPRRLHLPYQYVRRLSTCIAEAVFAYWDKASEWCLPRPASWWVEGRAAD